MTTERTGLLPQVSNHQNVRPRRLKWKRKSAAGLLLILLSSLLVSRSLRASVPDSIDHDFGVGFDLTSPYGTVSISYSNGTVVNVAKIEASKSYQATMVRLSLASSEHLHGPSYNSMEDHFKDQPRQVFRRARKEAGLPSSWDVGELASLILSLRSEVEKYLGRKISGAVATVPHWAALYSEDLLDAFEYAGLIYIPKDPYWWRQGIFPETGAVYVANGFGTCTNYTDIPSCQEENMNPIHQPHHETILSISYSRTLLTTMVSTESMGFSRPGSDHQININTDLGWERRHHNPNVEYYWEEVRRAILKPVLEGDGFGMVVEKVMVYGEHAMEEPFQKIVEDLVKTAFRKPPIIFQLDPTFSAARGAAEMAKRLSWKVNHTETS